MDYKETLTHLESFLTPQGRSRLKEEELAILSAGYLNGEHAKDNARRGIPPGEHPYEIAKIAAIYADIDEYMKPNTPKPSRTPSRTPAAKPINMPNRFSLGESLGCLILYGTPIAGIIGIIAYYLSRAN